MEQVIQLINKELGSQVTDSLQLEVDTLISVGIDLEQALIDPASDDNVVLREGDKLYIPTVDNTVKIDGGVMFPNTVAFDKGMRVKDYINQAGGFGNRARKTRAFAVNMNGTVTRIHSSKHITPGCTILVPAKPKRKRMSFSEILSLGTMTATLGTVIATLVK